MVTFGNVKRPQVTLAFALAVANALPFPAYLVDGFALDYFRERKRERVLFSFLSMSLGLVVLAPSDRIGILVSFYSPV